MSDLFVTERVGDVLVVAATRKLDTMAAEEGRDDFDELVQLVVDSDAQRLVFDLTLVDYLGSPALEWIIVLWRRMREKDGTFCFCCVSPVTRQILQVSRFDTVWPIYATRQEALDANKLEETSGD